jgi:DNA-binding IclR family transcriptional regulator
VAVVTGEGEDGERSLVPAITRAVAILDLLASTESTMGISAIARELNLPKSSVANLCSTLVDTELLRTQDGGLRLGRRLAQLGAAYLSGVDQVRLFQEACACLDVGRDETVQLAVLSDGLEVIYLAKRDGRFPVRLASTPGRALPATCTATGKAMLADLPAEELAARVAAAGALPRLTAHSVGTEEELLHELEVIRRRGYSIDQEEVIEGVVCVAVAIPRGGVGDQHLAASVTLLKPRATAALLRTLAGELTVLTAAVSEGLGMSGSRADVAG